MLYGNPIPGMLIADLNGDQQARLRQVLDGMVRERAGANGRAVLTNAVNIGVGTDKEVMWKEAGTVQGGELGLGR